MDVSWGWLLVKFCFEFKFLSKTLSQLLSQVTELTHTCMMCSKCSNLEAAVESWRNCILFTLEHIFHVHSELTCPPEEGCLISSGTIPRQAKWHHHFHKLLVRILGHVRGSWMQAHISCPSTSQTYTCVQILTPAHMKLKSPGEDMRFQPALWQTAVNYCLLFLPLLSDSAKATSVVNNKFTCPLLNQIVAIFCQLSDINLFHGQKKRQTRVIKVFFSIFLC